MVFIFSLLLFLSSYNPVKLEGRFITNTIHLSESSLISHYVYKSSLLPIISYLWSPNVAGYRLFVPWHSSTFDFIGNFVGNSLSFLPNVSRCIGDEVEMLCFVVPNGQMFIANTALLSFNGSSAATPTNINLNGLSGVDLSRYSADTTNLNISNERAGVRLTISDYQASDGATLFACHGLFSGLTPSAALVSGYPQPLAGNVVRPTAIFSHLVYKFEHIS